jgi:ribosome-associated protein
MTETSALENVFACAKAAADRKAGDLRVLDVRGLSSFTDYFLIASGSSDRRVQSIAEAVVEAMKERGIRPLGVEGVREGRWALIDFGEWVVHVFYEDLRAFYDLEGLWFDARPVEIPDEVLGLQSAPAAGARR